MAQFKFRLATLLRLREAARDERRAQLAEAYRAQQVLAERAIEKGQEINTLREEYAAAARPGRLQVDRLVDAQRFELLLRGEEQVLRQQSATLAEEVERRRLALVEADRQVRVLEQLRDKQQTRHDLDAARQETKEYDALAGQLPKETW